MFIITVLKFLTYYAQYYAHVFKSDCSIRVYSLVFNMVSVLLEYIDLEPNTSYYAGIMLDAFNYLLCSKLSICQHNWLVPT